MELAKLDVFICIETLQSYVDQLDFKSYRAAHKPRWTARHRKIKLQWAKEHINWTKGQWRNVVWSDKSHFCVEGRKRGKRVLRKEGERYDERSIVSTVKWSGSNAMVWKCFWEGSFERLEIIDTDSVDQEIYINILANRFHPWGFEYWPAQSPDLNSIEHVWNAHERQIERKRLSVKNLEQWKMAIQEEWARLDDEFADRLVRNMKKRCETVSKARGNI
ncbi:hypothetical protein G6F37_000681 [Rhizopus arrhizus]|nr:hypothetical protein G6F38_000845 [Rhizopus arrhizus]KAG1163998.1 hypothetical protein G6F37_000681 [Rhizopus arrhizus]